MIIYNLYDFLKKELKNGSSDLVTRQSGQLILSLIEKQIEIEDEGSVIALDFSNIGIIDYSCADEIIAKIISRLNSGEYGNKYVMLKGINDNHKENIEVALERKELALIAEMENGKRVLLGTLNNYLENTLQLIEKKENITAKDVSEALNLEANTSGTRLLNLYKKKLVKRKEQNKNGTRIWVYERIK